MFRWFRKRRSSAAVPDALWNTVLVRFGFLAALSPSDLARLRALAGTFLKTKEFHGGHGFTVTDEIALSIAAQAVLPILHLDLDGEPASALRWYDDFVGIVVHPGEVIARRETTDEAGVVHHWDELLAGEAMEGGPVMLSWQDVEAAGSTANQGYNVVIHEFIHKIDMRDGMADGCPPLPAGFMGTHGIRAAREAWMAVFEPEYERFREQAIVADRFGGPRGWLDPYGAEAPAEFFAVACEAYFVNRARFTADFPAMLALFDPFFMPRGPG